MYARKQWSLVLVLGIFEAMMVFADIYKFQYNNLSAREEVLVVSILFGTMRVSIIVTTYFRFLKNSNICMYAIGMYTYSDVIVS